MPEVYAQTFDLTPREQCDGAAAVTKALRSWIGDRWPADAPWFTIGEPGIVRTRDGNLFRWEPYADGDRAIIDFTWRHPHRGAPDIAWSTRVTYATPDRTLARLTMRVGNSGPDLTSTDALLTSRPRLSQYLRRYFGIRCDGAPLAETPRKLGADDVPHLVRYELFDPQRSQPVVVLSPHADGRFAIDPCQIADEFLGLATVVVLADSDAAWALTRELGSRSLSCFRGAMRVYLAGFSLQADPWQHPLILPHQLAVAGRRLRLAQTLALLTTRRFAEDPRLAELREERTVALLQRQQTMAKQMAASIRDAADKHDYVQLADAYATENSALKHELARLQAENEDLRDRIGQLESKVKALGYALRARGGSPAETEPTEADLFDAEAATVLEAVEHAQTVYAETLVFLPNAIETAAASPFRRPAELQHAFTVLAELARTAKTKGGELGRPLREILKERGIDYRPGIARTTSKKHRAQYEFVDEQGAVHVCEEHLCWGSSYDAAECLRVYLNSNALTQGRIIIGHVGEHLDGATTT